MAGFLYSPYSAYQHYAPPAPQPPARNKQASWKSGKSAEPTDYLDNLQRAQLKAILSQVNPNLTPRLRRANTKEVGVQVNPRVDTGVQCSLGPRTLRRPPPPPPPPEAVRFTRPLAVYSPVLERRLLSLRPTDFKNSQNEERGEEQDEREAEQEAEPSVEKSGDDHEELKRSAFQFLEQKYGYFHCKDCKTRWESAYVWCISGSNKVYFKQLCRKCQTGYNPYRVEEIQCQACSKTRCSCPQKKRHIDLKRPHRQELCGRCKNKRLSCDNTYSFKYIV
ncbi:ZAR1-like protein [Rana temporaria]|uniref:ZAR1-like protein n=1 Tax=Rana temporaria TaxID=8407 RepID=UPI001AACE779|nr:ZAR1-like protein [Rana temporaria]